MTPIAARRDVMGFVVGVDGGGTKTAAAVVGDDLRVVGAWAGVAGGEESIVAIAGTGATALGMSARGEFWRTDGWDYLLGDAGSGYRIGLEGIHEAMKMLDGRREPTILLRQLAECYGIDDAPAMRRLADSGTLG